MSGAVKGRLYILATAVLWSLSGAFIKGIDLPPETITFYRSLFAGLVLVPMLRPRMVRLTWRVGLLVVCYAEMVYTFVAATKWTSSANAILLQYTAPLYILVVSVLFLGERVARRSVVALVFGVGGIGVILSGQCGSASWGGVAAGLASGVGFAAVALLLRGLRGIDPLWLTIVQNVGTVALTLPVLWHRLGVDPSHLPMLALFGTVQIAAPYYLFARGLRTIPATEAGLIALIEPVLNPVWVVLVFGEWPSLWTALGGCLILCGLAWMYWPRPTRIRA